MGKGITRLGAFLCATAVAALPVFLGSGAHAQTTAVTADDFLNSIGVCTHIAQGLDNPTNVATCLTYAGIRNFRDDGSTNATTIQNWINVHNSTGAMACLLPINGDVNSSISMYEQVAAAHALLAVEGPNEPNNFPVTYNGQTSNYNTTFLPVAQFQAALYTAVKGDSKLAGIPVFASSEAGGSEPDNVGLQFLTIPSGSGVTLMPIGTQYADYANCHNYVAGNGMTAVVDNTSWNAEWPNSPGIGPWDGLAGEYGTTWRKGFAGYSAAQLPTLPRVTTETGWYTLSGGYQYTPSGASWTFTGNSGIQSNGSAWGAPNAPDGIQTAFLQEYNGVNGTITQTINFTSTGTYAVTLKAAARAGYGGQPFNVLIDGTVVGTFTPTSTTSFTSFTTNNFTISTTGNHTLKFAGTATTGSTADFIDAVTIPGVSIPNFSFETPAVSTGLTQDQQGKLLLNLYLTAFREGWSATFVYYLHDTASQGAWGLFDANYNAKLSGTYLHNLTTILADTTSFTPGSLNYSIPNEPSTVHDLLIQKSNGKFELAVWNDRPVGEGSNSVTVNLGGTYSVNQYDPTVGTSATSLGSVSSVSLTLTDHPVILEISSGGVPVANGSFETPNVGAGGYQYNPTGGTWTFTGNSGIESNGSAWAAANAPDGTQAAFLQESGGVNGTITQSVNFASTGTYTVSLQAAARVAVYGGGQPLNVLIDGTVVGTFTPTSSSSFTPYTTNPFTISTAGAHTLTLAGAATSGGCADFVDAVTIQAAIRTNVALASNGATATASSTYSSGYSASGAINGDRTGLNWGNGGGWNDATAGVWPDWLEVDFSGSKTITEIDVFTKEDGNPVEPTLSMTFTLDGITAFDVQYWNGSAWVTVPNGSVTGNNKVWRQFAFGAITTSKIRVVVNAADGANGPYSRITEVEAW